MAGIEKMKLSDKQKHILRAHKFSAIYVIGTEGPVVYPTEEQISDLEKFLSDPKKRYNRPREINDFLTWHWPAKIGATSNPADNIVNVADGYSFNWKYTMLARIWFPSPGAAQQMVEVMMRAYPEAMRKSWVDLRVFQGREFLEFEIKTLANLRGMNGLDDLEMAETLEELWYQNAKRELGL